MSEMMEGRPWKDRKGGSVGIPEYDDNPFVSCLPPPPSERDCFEHLVSMPLCTDAERMLEPHLREQLVFIRMKQAFFPVGLQLRQAKQIDLLIRGGYVARNPSTATWQAGVTALALDAGEGSSSVRHREREPSVMAADSMVALGPSGIGKTTVLRRMLDGYPQVVRHEGEGTGVITQIVWLRVEAASDGSPKQTVLSMFSEIDRLLGTNYVERHGKLTREQLLVKAQQICARYAIGLIAVDEIQNLTNSKAGHSDLMSFLTSLVNVVNVPILMIGTMKALPMMTSCFRTARRGEGNGSIIYEPIPNGEEWRTFVKTLFRFQWTATVTEVDTGLIDVFWEESQGIIDVAVKLFVLSQMRAIRLGAKRKGEAITIDLVRKVADDSLKLVRPMLDALRRKDWKALAGYEDLAGLDAVLAGELQRNWPGAEGRPDLEQMASSIARRLEGPQGDVADGLMAAALSAQGVDAGEMAAIKEMIAKARSSTDPIAALAAPSSARRSASPRGDGGKRKAVPTDPSDVRVAVSGVDPVKGLAAAGLLDAV